MGSRTRRREGPPGAIRRAIGRLAEIGGRLSRRQWLTLTAFVGLCVGVRIGLGRLERTVREVLPYNPAPRIQLVDLPAWVVQEGWAERFAASIVLDPSDRWLDPGLCTRVAQQVARSGWVKRVRWVRQESDGTIRVSCEFRRPIGMVRTDQGYIPVDAECVRLPEVYESLGPGWIGIAGIECGPCPIGQRWPGDDVRAAVDLTRELMSEPWCGRIRMIDVANFGGRKNRRAHPIVLVTDTGTEIRWGSAPGREVFEPKVVEKKRLIERELSKPSLPAWIDVSVFADRVIIPEPGKNQTEYARGSLPGR